MYRRDWS